MRDKTRIKRICKLLEQIWSKTPDWRFGQLLINYGVCEDSLRAWQNEDKEFEEYLIKINEKLIVV